MLNIIIGRFLEQSIKAFVSNPNLMTTLIQTLEHFVNQKMEDVSEMISTYYPKKLLGGKEGALFTLEGERMLVELLGKLL